MSGAGVLKSPVQDQCESAGLTGCPQIADGVVLYADGKQAEGQDKLKSGAAANNPKDVREFAKALRTVTSLPLPGVSQYTAPVNQIAKLLATEADAVETLAAKPAPEPSKAKATESEGGTPVDGQAPVQEQAQAPAQITPVVVNDGPAVTQTVSESTQAWSGRRQCYLFGRTVNCAPVQQGPFIVTDIVALPGCKDAMYVGANARDVRYGDAISYTFKWAVEAQQPGIHGALLAVPPGESLLVAVEPKKEGTVIEDPKCVVTWSGYRPRRQGQ